MSYIGPRGIFVGLGVGAGTGGNIKFASEGVTKLTLFLFFLAGSALNKRELGLECCFSQIQMKRFTLTDALTDSHERLNYLISLSLTSQAQAPQ